MKGSELIRKLKALGTKQGVDVRVDQSRGKGSHQTLHYGSYRSTIPDPKRELKSGTLKRVLTNLGFAEGRFEDH